MQIDRRASATRCLSLALLALAAAVSCAAQTGPPAGVAAPEMFATVTVTDKNQTPVPNMPRGAFGAWEGKTARELTSFVSGDAPASVAILFDLSDSVRVAEAGRLKAAADALSRFTRLGSGSKEYFVYAFAEEVSTVLDGSSDPEAAAQSIRSAASALSGHHSSFWDACYLAVPKLGRGTNAKRALILVTDGEDTYSRAREDDVLRLLKESNVVVYSFDVGRPRAGEPRSEGARALEKLSKVSGGLLFRPRDAKDWDAAVEAIAAELRSQYVLGIKPAAMLAAGQCVNIKIRLTPPDGFAAGEKELVVRSREEFCTPRADVRRKKSP